MKDRQAGSAPAWRACAEGVRPHGLISGNIGHRRKASPSSETIG